jgi:UDP-2,4-diacetamido-2,4,6-trideoxy-beta-L-altropyranose hydrolase
MRCIALAQAWQDSGGMAVFASVTSLPALTARLSAEQIELRKIEALSGSPGDAGETARLGMDLEAQWVVADGYDFKSSFYSALKEKKLRIMVIDDYGHTDRYDADLILNQNIYGKREIYEGRAPSARLLLGCRYVLLRREFLQCKSSRREIPDAAKHILITMGGSDYGGLTLKILDIVNSLRYQDLEIKVLAGGGTRKFGEIEAVSRLVNCPMEVHHATSQMPAFMAWADIAICAAGSTIWELAFMGLPAIAYITAQNQHSLRGNAALEKVILLREQSDLSDRDNEARRLEALIEDRARRQIMSQSGQALVDGLGARRVVEELLR